MRPTPPPPPRPAVPGRRAPWLGLAMVALALLLVLPYVGSETELVRLRNALSLAPEGDFTPADDWTPPAVPAGYRVERVAADPYFVAVADRLALADAPDDWARAVAISRHLLGSAPKLNGGAIQDDLRSTYRRIVERGDGYCGDFVRVFSAVAQAAGMTVRPWAFSLDGFGGHGHVFVEVWNRQRQRWQLVDVFQNYWFSGGDAGEPLSALAFRGALTAGSPTPRLHPLHDGVPPGWAVEAKAWDYFRRGLDGWYLPFGSNPFSQDAALPVRAFDDVSRAAQGVGALLAGVAAPIRMLATPANAVARASMRRLRVQVWAAMALGLAGSVLALVGAARCLARRGAARAVTGAAWPRACVVGPLPPPGGGMANQCEQLLRLLQQEGAQVLMVRTNAPYWPRWVGRVPGLRAGFRLLPYLVRLWRSIGRAQVVHVFANSGWAWHLLAAPALAIARLRGVPAIVNYRGGQADEFLASAPRVVHRQLAGAAARVTPSAFLQRVFARHGLSADAIPNVIDLSRFPLQPFRDPIVAPHLVVTRHLEPIYDIPTALRAFAVVRRRWSRARLTVAGSGPLLAELQALAGSLGVADAVTFAGRIDNARIAALYASADVVLNSSTVDNMPISILEALASGVPVVSTAAGGIPDLVEHDHTALLVPVGDAEALARAVLRLLEDRPLAWHLREAGLALVAQYAWPRVRERWQAAYRDAIGQREPA